MNLIQRSLRYLLYFYVGYAIAHSCSWFVYESIPSAVRKHGESLISRIYENFTATISNDDEDLDVSVQRQNWETQGTKEFYTILGDEYNSVIVNEENTKGYKKMMEATLNLELLFSSFHKALLDLNEFARFDQYRQKLDESLQEKCKQELKLDISRNAWSYLPFYFNLKGFDGNENANMRMTAFLYDANTDSNQYKLWAW